MKKTIIEVGGNLGQHTRQFVSPDTQLFVFEPVVELYYKLWDRYKSNPNVLILPFAIDEKCSIQKFNVAAVPGESWGVSSLNEFSDDLEITWPGRKDFKFTHSYMVPTLRLDTFCELYGITSIDYLWVDAQGHDFKVLKSLGSMITSVKEGRCEAAYKVKLYKNTDNQHSKITQYLSQFNFTTQTSPDSTGAECDILFSKK